MIFVSILLFIISPLMSLPIIILGIICDKKYRIIYLFLLAFSIGIFSYYFKPNRGMDLYRYFLIMDSYKNVNIQTLLRQLFVNINFEPIFQILFYMIGKTQNYYLLSFICTVFSYFTVFYMINDYSKKIELKGIYTFFITIFFILTFNYIYFASGLRFLTATIVFCLAVYLEYVKGKKGLIYKLLYILPFMMHKSLFVAILFRLLMSLDFSKMKKIYILVAFIIFVSPNVLILFSKIFTYIPAFSIIYDKALLYIKTKNIFTADSITMVYFIVTVFLIAIFIYNNKYFKEATNKKFNDVFKMLTIFTLSILSYTLLFQRFSTIIRILGLLSFMDYLKCGKNKNNKTVILIMALIIMALSIKGQRATLSNVSFGNLFYDSNYSKNVFALLNKR